MHLCGRVHRECEAVIRWSDRALALLPGLSPTDRRAVRYILLSVVFAAFLIYLGV
jgi:hypothetical protein